MRAKCLTFEQTTAAVYIVAKLSLHTLKNLQTIQEFINVP